MPIQVEVFVNYDDGTFVCTQGRPLSLPLVQTWHKDNGHLRPFDCMLDSAGVLWTNMARGSNDGTTVYRRVTWRETLNIVNNSYPEILGEVIGAAAEIQPHLIGMMRKYGEFSGNQIVLGFLGGNDGQE